ncbi:MAG: 50S ribosomal protein L30 [Thermoplasmata archaeon]
MAFAVVRVRGSEQAGERVKRTLRQLRLNRINHLVFVRQDPTMKGMLEAAKDYITWGEVSAEMIAKILIKRGEPVGKRGKVNDDFVKQNSEKYKSVLSFAKAIQEDEATLSSVNNLQPVIRLHPPRGGYENVKKSYPMGGSLGYRGKDIEALLERMIVPLKGE